ncbi:hypothetical protein [Streptomyces sp. NPDC048057]|uniref:hypothetical protein n=1 Tax=Streptomyces sp. NPDC048057 TaxID=3155628 RepID=UPI0033CEB9E3
MTARKTEPTSFDAWWTEVHGARTTEVCGLTVKVPSDLPYGFNKRFEELQDSDSDEDAAELVALLFGEEAASAWLDGPDRIGTRQLFTILGWGMAQAQGEDVSYQEAYDAVMEQVVGKAPEPNRAERRAAAQKRPSRSTGGRSKPTSSGSTTSARKTSRG